MCGIFGWIHKKDSSVNAESRTALAKVLAESNTRRGPHSWGAYLYHDKPNVLRGVGGMASVKGIDVTLASANCVMGHTRWATVGEVTVENCHPFTVKGITLAHNGGIFNHHNLLRKYARQCAVDSMHLAHHVADGLPFNDLEGYGAIEYTRDEAPGAVYLCRMSGGELAVYGLGTKENPLGVVWSSDASHLRAALHAAKVDAFPYERMKEGRVYVADADGVLYILPKEIVHELGRDNVSADTRRRHMEVTSGKSKEAPPPSTKSLDLSGHDLTESEEKGSSKSIVLFKPGQNVERDPFEDLWASDDRAVEERARMDMDADAMSQLALLQARIDND